MTNVLTQVKVPTEALQDVVLRAAKGSTNIDVIPLTLIMQIVCKDNVLYAITTNNVNFLTTKMDLNQKYAGSTTPVTVPDFNLVVYTKKFADLIAKLTTDYVTLTIEDVRVIVEANGKYDIPLATDTDGSIPQITVPTVDTNGKTMHVELTEVQSILSLNKVCKADSKDRPALFNYYFDEIGCLTTNAQKACSNPVKLSDRPICVGPYIVDLLPTVTDPSYGLDISQNDTFIVLSSPNGTLIGKKESALDVSEFPAEPFRQLISQPIDHTTEVNRSLMLEAVQRISLFTDKMDNNKMSLTFEKEGVTITAENQGTESVSYLKPFTDDVAAKTLVIDGNHFIAELNACSAETLVIKFQEGVGLILEVGDIVFVMGVLD